VQAYRLEAIIQEDGSLTLQHLPFRAGERVEVIVLEQASKGGEPARYPLHGTRVTYVDPAEPVAEDDWESAR
jgi:hypothetical protein